MGHDYKLHPQQPSGFAAQQPSGITTYDRKLSGFVAFCDVQSVVSDGGLEGEKVSAKRPRIVIFFFKASF
jgi:hypothetical protein